MAQASLSGSLLPPLANVSAPWAKPGSAREEGCVGRRACAAPGRLAWWPAPAHAGEDPEVGAANWRREASSGGPIPPALQRLRAVLLRLHRERELLRQAQDCARLLQAVLRLLGPSTPAGGPHSLPQLCGDLLLYSFRGTAPRIGLRDTAKPLLLARIVGLVAQPLEAAVEVQLRAVGRAPASLALMSQLAELLQALPVYHRLQGKAVNHIPRAEHPFSPARVLRLLATERGCQVADRLSEALRGSGLQDQLRKQCVEERILLPGLLGLVGGVAGTDRSGLGLGEAGSPWSQYWTLLWAACTERLDLILGPWRDHRAVAQQLSQALGRASLPQECEEELTSLCHSLLHQSVIWSWDKGFCQVLGSALGDQSSPAAPSHTTQLLQQLFPPLLDTIKELRSRHSLCHTPGPEAVALGLCTLQTTLLWFWGRTQQHLAAWAPGSFLLLIQKDLPPLLHEVEALCSLSSEGSLTLEMQKLTALMQFLPEESLSVFYQECYKQATQGFKLHMPQSRYWRLRLCPEFPSAPSEYAGMVVRPLLEPVLQVLKGLPLQAQAPALGQALTAILGAWLDHILTHGIRFSLQGALQLKQDFGVVKEMLEEEQWGLSPELRQTLLMLSIFQQLDGALLCLLQQPLPKVPVHRRPSCCCVFNEVQTTDLSSSSLNSLESLAPPLRLGAVPAQTTHLLSTPGGGGPSPEAYLVGNQQAWLALRLHQHSRWHLPFFSCLGTSSES